jgi:hypothetical protein
MVNALSTKRVSSSVALAVKVEELPLVFPGFPVIRPVELIESPLTKDPEIIEYVKEPPPPPPSAVSWSDAAAFGETYTVAPVVQVGAELAVKLNALSRKFPPASIARIVTAVTSPSEAPPEAVPLITPVSPSRVRPAGSVPETTE